MPVDGGAGSQAVDDLDDGVVRLLALDEDASDLHGQPLNSNVLVSVRREQLAIRLPGHASTHIDRIEPRLVAGCESCRSLFIKRFQNIGPRCRPFCLRRGRNGRCCRQWRIPRGTNSRTGRTTRHRGPVRRTGIGRPIRRGDARPSAKDTNSNKPKHKDDQRGSTSRSQYAVRRNPPSNSRTQPPATPRPPTPPRRAGGG